MIALLDSSGNKVAEYAYDAWGNHVKTPSSFIGNYNPFRYRGYVYDRETGLYYLQSRYYNPQIGRFISADAYVSTSQGLTGNNMFAYGGNRVVSQKYSQTGSEGRIVSSLSNNFITTPSGSNHNSASSGSLAGAYSFNMFGGETRFSAGWEDGSAFVDMFFLRVGMSSYTTISDGSYGLIYGFAGTTTDIMNICRGTLYAGIGINLGGYFSFETQVEALGVGQTITIGNFTLSTSVNVFGATSITAGLNQTIADGVVRTDAFTIAVNTGSAAFLAVAVYRLVTIGDPSLLHQYVENALCR